MNANQLQKYYDQLTPRERYAAKLAAKARADEPEIMALDRSAPKVVYDVTHHYFYQEAWEHLASFHLVEMLNMGCAFYQGQGVLFLDQAAGEWGEKADRIFKLLTELAKTIIGIDAAWRKFCELEQMDPEAVMLNIPGSGVYSADAPKAILNKYDTLPRLLEEAHVLDPGDLDPQNQAELVEVYRATLHRLAGNQSGGWG